MVLAIPHLWRGRTLTTRLFHACVPGDVGTHHIRNAPMDSRDNNEQRTAAEAGWHTSCYNLFAPLPDSKNVVIFNTRTRSSAEYSPIELYIMNVLDMISENHPLVSRLARQGVIVNYDEREAFVAQRRIDCATPSMGKISITICPTMACNFECPYCFSNRYSGKMSPEVQDDIVELVRRMLDAAAAKKLSITWFGGEPLLGIDVIEKLSPRLIALAEERGVEYESWIFTNGYLLTPDVVDLLLRCQIRNVHIPFDGVGATHDATRRLIGGGPTFDRLLDNLALLHPPIHTLIRANTHRGNVSELDELKTCVMARAKEAGNDLAFYAASLVDVSPRDEPSAEMAAYAFDGIEVSLRPEARHVPVGKDHACVAQNLWMVAIDDKGYLYKCGGKLCGQSKFAYGTAREWDPARPLATASNPDMLSRFLNTGTPTPDDACYECAWLPICGGGCPQLRLFGKHACPPYRRDPERFILAMHERSVRRKAKRKERDPERGPRST